MSNLSKNCEECRINKEQIIENIKKKIDELKETIKANKLNNIKREGVDIRDSGNSGNSGEYDMCYFDSKLFGDSFKAINNGIDVLITQIKVIIVFNITTTEVSNVSTVYYQELQCFSDGAYFIGVEHSDNYINNLLELVNAHLDNNNLTLNLYVPTNAPNLLNNLSYDLEGQIEGILLDASERINFEKLENCSLLDYIRTMEQNKNNTTSNNLTYINKNLKKINRKLDKILNKDTK